VGTAAIQLARQAGAAVIITAGGPERIQRCLELGASFGINYKEEDFASRVMEFTRGQGVDVILDWIGAPYLQKHIRILRSGGRLVLIGLMGRKYRRHPPGAVAHQEASHHRVRPADPVRLGKGGPDGIVQGERSYRSWPRERCARSFTRFIPSKPSRKLTWS